MKLGGCQVVLKCNNRVVREIDTGVTEDGEISCYIESKPGEVSTEVRPDGLPCSGLNGTTIKQEFLIEYSRNLNYGPPGAELLVNVFLNGVPAGPGWIADDPPSSRAKKITGQILGVKRGVASPGSCLKSPNLLVRPRRSKHQRPMTNNHTTQKGRPQVP